MIRYAAPLLLALFTLGACSSSSQAPCPPAPSSTCHLSFTQLGFSSDASTIPCPAIDPMPASRVTGPYPQDGCTHTSSACGSYQLSCDAPAGSLLVDVDVDEQGIPSGSARATVKAGICLYTVDGYDC